MPGDMSACATTFSTVVREGPWMCSAEMQASISRCRWRARDARSGAGTAFTLLAFFLAMLSFTSRPEPGRARHHGRKLYTAPSLYRKIPHRHLSGGNHEIHRAAGPLAHHPAAPAVPHRLLPHPVRLRLQDQPGRDGTAGTAVYRHF